MTSIGGDLTISVVIPTYNGVHKIAALLESLTRQTVRPSEVIVMSDGSTDNTGSVVAQFHGRIMNLRFLEQENQGRSRVRNNGFRHATGDVVVFFDDDMSLTPTVIERHKAFHLQHSGLYCGNSVEVVSADRTDVQNYKAMLTVKWTDKYAPGITKLSFENLFFTAANCSVRRELFLELGGFDERLNDAEDFDLGYRALERGYSVYFDKENITVHRDNISCESYVRRLIQYKAAHQRLAGLHPERQLTRSQQTRIPLTKKVFYWPMSFPFWTTLIDKSKVLYLIPGKLRYKLYDIVIYAQSNVYPRNTTKP
jgi:glycosyltransferase involved in cell wall biosynthesis